MCGEAEVSFVCSEPDAPKENPLAGRGGAAVPDEKALPVSSAASLTKEKAAGMVEMEDNAADNVAKLNALSAAVALLSKLKEKADIVRGDDIDVVTMG